MTEYTLSHIAYTLTRANNPKDAERYIRDFLDNVRNVTETFSYVKLVEHDLYVEFGADWLYHKDARKIKSISTKFFNLIYDQEPYKLDDVI